MFCSIETARRIERAESALMADSAAAAMQRRPTDPCAVRSFSGGVAVFAGKGSPLSKVAGIGFAGLPDEGGLAEIEAMMSGHGAPTVVELSTLAEAGVGKMLTRRGYRLCGHENILGRALAPGAHADESGVVTRVAGDGELGVWLDTVATGFVTPDPQGVASHESFPREMIEGAMLDMAKLAGYRRYLAERGGKLAGGASVRVFEGVANLCGASTLPEHRRRGVQTSLLNRRLSDAAGLGCDLAVITTQPGSKSQENAMRHGLALLYARAVLVREAG